MYEGESAVKSDRRLLDTAYRVINTPPLSGLFRSYRLLWEVAALTPGTARDAVLYKSNETGFEAQAQRDADRLGPFLTPEAVVLDLGCGVGRIMKYVAPRCRQIRGVDISRGMLRHARRRLNGINNVRLHENNGKDLGQFPDSSFDLVYSFLMLQHLEREDVYVYLEEAHRLLKPSGRAFLQFVDLMSDSGFRWFTEYARKRSRHAARVRPNTDCEIEWLLSKVGFVAASITREGGYIYALATKL